MLLTKEVAVYLNLVACQFKQHYAMLLKQNGFNITPEQLLVLDMLWNQGSMSQQKIADSIGKDKNSVTKLIDALESKDLVSRRRDDSDRRSNTIILTEKAKRIKADTKEQGVSMLEEILAGIDENELKSLVDTLKKISGNMKGR